MPSSDSVETMRECDIRAMIAMITYLAESAEELTPPADAMSRALEEALTAALAYQEEHGMGRLDS